MRKFILPLLASLAVASPALANETRVETRAGVIWSQGDTEAIAGIAGGYDFDLGPGAFTGVEVSGDKVLESNTKVAWGFTGRAGAKFLGTKVYAAGGYTTKPCDGCEGSWHAGAGVERTLFGPLYGKVEYRHYFTDNLPDSNAVVGGVGVKF